MGQASESPVVHRFYSRSLPACDECNRPASHQALGPHNASYGNFCARHIAGALRRLEATHRDVHPDKFPRA